MCGRYTLTRHDVVAEELQAALGTAPENEWWKPRFNVAPTQPAPVITLHDGVRTIDMMRWGFLPHWAAPGKQGKEGKRDARPPLMINARTESLFAKAWFRDAMARKRCLVPADGFFEWRREAKVKGQKAATPLPVYFHRAGRKMFAFAGLWARLRTDAGEQLSFTIITGKPNDLVRPIHDRMPVILDASAWAAWLDPAVDAEAAKALLAIPATGDWIGDAVSTWVNSAQHDDPRCIEPEAPV
ncbi:MAG: SOS response-associated peptidase [Deltaproteobacteria bacterium]|nr:SOS response-associated peptidase [Deltaproteobacteria bacterium]